jgi:protein involved in polysaccharide export with SLBB domain
MCDSPKSDAPETEAGETLIAYALKDTLEAQVRANPYVRPGDIIRVAEAEQAYIVGAVKTPVPIVLKGRETLTDAIARAGGLAPGADMEKIRILRQTEGTTNKTEIVANLKAINKHQKEDILLRPNDVIDVPGPSGAKKFLNELTKTLLPQLTYLPLRVIP